MNLVVNGIEPNDGVDSLQRPRLPTLYSLNYLISNSSQRTCGNIYTVHFLQVGGDVFVTHAKTVKGNDLLFQFITHGDLMLFHDLGQEGSITIMRRP